MHAVALYIAITESHTSSRAMDGRLWLKCHTSPLINTTRGLPHIHIVVNQLHRQNLAVLHLLLVPSRVIINRITRNHILRGKNCTETPRLAQCLILYYNVEMLRGLALLVLYMYEQSTDGLDVHRTGYFTKPHTFITP